MKQKVLAIYFFLAFVCYGAIAQNICNISGVVLDAGNEPVQYASAVLYDSGKVLKGAVTDEKGQFSLSVSRSAKELVLAVEFIGYGKVEKKLVLDKPSIIVGNIILKDDAIALGEAVVVAKAAEKKSTVEHTSINASANMASAKGSAVDVLKGASTVTVLDDAISIRGNRNILVLMDGIPTTVSDLSAVPAANIKSIEIITNPDASYDAEGTGGIINIVSKKETARGFAGVVSANYGFSHFVTGNVAFSFNRPKASYRFNYNTKYEDDAVNTTLERLIKETGALVSQKMVADRYTFNTNIGFGADFRLDKKNTLNLDLKFMMPRLNVEQTLHNTFSGYGAKREEERFNDVTWNRENLEGGITYKHVIVPDKSDFTLKGSVSKIWGHRPSYYYLEGVEVNRSNSGGSPFITSLQGDFSRKFAKGTLAAGAKVTYRSNDIYHEFYTYENGGWEYSQAFSNDLLHTETIPAAYVMFSSKPAGKFSYKAGLRGEFSTVTLDSRHSGVDARRNDFFLAPTLQGVYKMGKGQELALAFSRRIGRPTYPQLNPYMSMVDATTYEQGNMNLLPEKSNKLDMSYNLSGRAVQFFADAYLNYTADFISQVTKLENDLLVTTYINAASDLKAGADISLKLMPAGWLNATLSANTFYTDTRGSFEGADIDNSGWANNSNLLLDIMPGKRTDVQLQYFVTTPQYYPQLTTALTHYMNVGVKQKFLKGAMNVSLLLTDVFGTYRWKVTSNNRVFDLTNTSTGKSRMFWIGVTYNLNSFKARKGENKQETDRSLIKLGL